MDQLNQSGIFYFSSTGSIPAEFPEDCRRTFRSRFEPQFTGLFVALALVIFLTVGLLSRIKPRQTVTEQDMIKIQERYARLVLNQEMPKKEEPKIDLKAQQAAAQRAAAEAAAEAEETAASERRKTETVVEKTARKQATSTQRAVKREAMKRQIENVGLFAELTAVGSGGGSGKGPGGKGGVRDLIGNIDATASLSNMSISGSSFATKRAGTFQPGEGGGGGGRRGERAEGGTLSTSGLSSATAGTFKSEGKIEGSVLENIQGEAVNDVSRDMKTLQQVLQRYSPRLKKVYEDFLKRNPDLSGKMVVKFTIEADGSVSGVVLVSSDLNDRELERNLIRYIERIKFPSASGKLTIEWPLIFSAT
jgi:TonB family protein